MYLLNLSALLKIILSSSHLWGYFEGNSSLLILPHCQAERRRRLRRHHIWLWGHDPPPGQAPPARLPDPSAAWSGSQSLDAQEMTAKRRQRKKRGRKGSKRKKNEMGEQWCSSSNFLFGYCSKKKREKVGLGMDEERGDCIRDRRRKKRVHCGFTVGQKTSHNISQVLFQ